MYSLIEVSRPTVRIHFWSAFLIIVLSVLTYYTYSDIAYRDNPENPLGMESYQSLNDDITPPIKDNHLTDH